MQDLYEIRPSRPEDLEMISDLEEQIVVKDAFIKKQEDDMKFYKLELINREQSYNQMFGTAPKIGMLDVVPQIGKPNIVKQSTKKLVSWNYFKSNHFDILFQI